MKKTQEDSFKNFPFIIHSLKNHVSNILIEPRDPSVQLTASIKVLIKY